MCDELLHMLYMHISLLKTEAESNKRSLDPDMLLSI